MAAVDLQARSQVALNGESGILLPKVGRRRQRESLLRKKVSFSKNEYEEVERQAAAAGLPTATYIRRRVMESAPPTVLPHINLEQWIELRKLAQRIIDVAMDYKLASIAGSDPLIQELRWFSERIDSLRLAVLGIQE